MDITHHAQRFQADYRIMLVDRKSLLDVERLDCVLNGGTVERNQDTDITEKAELQAAGVGDVSKRLLRIYADLSYEDGTTETVLLGTFIPDAPKREIGGAKTVTPLQCYGLLQQMAAAEWAAPVSVKQGSNPMDFIERTIRECGLQVAPHEPCSYRLGSTWTFGMQDSHSNGTTKLQAVNDLLGIIGWNGLRTDTYGRVVLRPYVEPKNRAPSWAFREGPGARFLREMTDETDWFDTKNQIVTVYEDKEREIRGLAQDNDPNSPFSIPSRGFTISETYKYTDIPEGKSDAQLRTMANDKARQLLATAQAVIRRIEFTHIYAPVTIGDVIEFDYASADVSGRFAVRTQRLTLGAGLTVHCEARSFAR